MNSIKENFIYNLIYQILLIILPLITTPYISRVLGSEGVGTYTYTYTVANYFMLAAMLGVKNYGNRSVAAIRDDKQSLSKTFWEIYGLQFLCSAIALGAYFFYVLLFEREYRVIALIQGIYVFSGLLDVSWLFFGTERFKTTVMRNIAIRLINLVCVFVFVRTRADLWKNTRSSVERICGSILLIMTIGTALLSGLSLVLCEEDRRLVSSKDRRLKKASDSGACSFYSDYSGQPLYNDGQGNAGEHAI